MPIDIQCPDCEHVFGVPTSMAGKRTLCRSCNAALIVPGEVGAEAPLELPPIRPNTSKRLESAAEKPPNWDTPIPFHSPGPIVGVLLIALLASTLVLVGYGLARTPTVVTKSQPYVAPKPQPIYPDPKPADPKPTAGYDREVILPNREVILPKSSRGTNFLGNAFLPTNWLIAKDSTGIMNLHDAERGTIAGSLALSNTWGIDSTVTASLSGRWVAQIAGPKLELYSTRITGGASQSWEPYPSRKLLDSALLSDSRLLTMSGDSSFDLWAIPSGEFIRRVAVLPTDRSRVGIGTAISIEQSLLAIRDESKIAVYSLDDDAFGPTVEFAAAGDSKIAFTPDGTRVVALSTVEAKLRGLLDDRVEIFELASKKRIHEWTLSSNRRVTDALVWSAGSDGLLLKRADLRRVAYHRLSDGRLLSSIETGDDQNPIRLDGPGQRILFFAPEPPGRLYGFDLPLRTPGNLQKNPVWEYKAGVLELQKAAR